MICTYDTSFSGSCPDMQVELGMFIGLLSTVDQIKFSAGDHEPTWEELAALWDGAAVPANSFVFWENTNTSILSWWFNPTGDCYELT